MSDPKPTQEQIEAAKKIFDIAYRQPPDYDGQQGRDAAAFLAARDAEILRAKPGLMVTNAYAGALGYASASTVEQAVEQVKSHDAEKDRALSESQDRVVEALCQRDRQTEALKIWRDCCMAGGHEHVKVAELEAELSKVRHERDLENIRALKAEARIKDAMNAGYGQGVEATEARAIKRIDELEAALKDALDKAHLWERQCAMREGALKEAAREIRREFERRQLAEAALDDEREAWKRKNVEIKALESAIASSRQRAVLYEAGIPVILHWLVSVKKLDPDVKGLDAVILLCAALADDKPQESVREAARRLGIEPKEPKDAQANIDAITGKRMGPEGDGQDAPATEGKP